MVLLLQLALFGLFAFLRGRFLFGTHLKNRGDYLDYISTAKRSITARHVGIQRVDGIPFVIRRERWYHKIIKFMGLAAEIQLGDHDFDRKYLIITDSPEHLEQALKSTQLFQDIKALFALPVKSLHATPKKLWCVIKREDIDKGAEFFQKHLKILRIIADQSQRHAMSNYSGAVQSGLPKWVWAALFLCAHAGLLTLALFGGPATMADSVDTTDNNTLIMMSTSAALIAMALWVLLMMAIFRGNSWVCWVLTDFVLCGILGFLVTSALLIREANIHFDRSPPHVYHLAVRQMDCILKCHKSCGRRCTKHSEYQMNTEQCLAHNRSAIEQHYKRVDYICAANSNFRFDVTINHWKPAPNPIYQFSPLAPQYDTMRKGGYVNVTIREGALGVEWLDQDAIAP